MGHIQLVVEQALGDGKDGCIRADGQRQGQRGNRREPRAFAQNADAVAQIGPEFIPPAQPQRGAHALLMDQRRPERNAGPPRRFCRCVTGADQVGGQGFQVASQLGLHLRFQAVALSHGPQP